VDCFSCGNPAVNACRRCTKRYCEEHGNERYCAECLQPASALPSFNLYRGALLTLLVGSALALLLLVRPPDDSSGASPVVVGRSTATATPEDGAEPTVAPQTPAASSTPATPQPTATPSAEPTPTVGPREYTVQEGDSLSSIAEATAPPGADLNAYVEQIAALNGLDPVDPIINPGDVLRLPPAP
jgi:hypothetical protein